MSHLYGTRESYRIHCDTVYKSKKLTIEEYRCEDAKDFKRYDVPVTKDVFLNCSVTNISSSSAANVKLECLGPSMSELNEIENR